MTSPPIQAHPETEEVTEPDVLAAVAQVGDPCVALSGLHVSVRDLGLIEEVSIRGDHVDIAVVFTEIGCPFSVRVLDEVQRAVEALPGVRSVRVRSLPKIWTTDRMRPAAQTVLDESRVGLGRAPGTARS